LRHDVAFADDLTSFIKRCLAIWIVVPR